MKVRDASLSPDEPSPQELLELGRVELGRVETLLEEQLLLLGGGQLLGSEVPVRRVHVQRAQLRCRRVPLSVCLGLGLPGWLLGPVARAYTMPACDWLDAALGWPVVFEGGARGEVPLDLLQSNHLANIVGEELVPDSQHLAAELQVGQVPSVHHLRLQLEVFSLSLEIEERHILGALLHCVRHHRLAVDPEEAAPKLQVGQVPSV